MNNLSEDYNLPPEDSNPKKNTWVWFGIVGALLILLIVSAYLIGWWRMPPPTTDPVETVISDENFLPILESSLSRDNTNLLRKYFVAEIAAGENDARTRTAAYWMTVPYLLKESSIYDIYNLIKDNPELAFLNEAELIYPTVFKMMEDRTVKDGSIEASLVLLAYYEILDKYGYGGIALWGTAARKYAELAYRAKLEYEENKLKGEDYKNILRALFYTQAKSQVYIERISSWLQINTKRTMTLEELNYQALAPAELLFGLQGYAIAIATLQGSGKEVFTFFDINDIYEFNYSLVASAEELSSAYFYTSYKHAGLLLISGSATPDNVALPLSRAIKNARGTDPARWSVIGVTDVINYKERPHTAVTNSADADPVRNINMTYAYSADIAKRLAELNPDFKNWLVENGWTEEDFK